MRPLRTRLTGALLTVPALTTATACGGSTATAPAQKTAATATDGTQVTVEQAERLVPLSGSLSEIVFTLGLGDRVVARDITATFEQAAKLPVVTRGDDVGPRIQAVADALGVPASGKRLTERSQARIAAVRKEVPQHDDPPRVVSVEDGVLLHYGPRTDQVLNSVVEQLYKKGDAA